MSEGLSIDQELAIAEVELAITELILLLDEAVEEWVEPEDRGLVIKLMAWSYVLGYYDAKAQEG